jgi:hypothetical protein
LAACHRVFIDGDERGFSCCFTGADLTQSANKKLRGSIETRVVLADDHPFVLLGIRATFSTDESPDVVGEAGSAAALLTLLVSTPCDVLVTDFAMPEHGLQAEDG